ncbi:MAG: FAD binding domain-containing protein [Pseudomonadota bacterium]
MNINDFIIPESLDEARAALKKLGSAALPVAGATAMRFFAEQSSRTAVSIARLGLDGIGRPDAGENGKAFRVGAATTLAALMEHRADGWVLDRVARCVATQQVRNISTIGGNIARVFPWADLPVALLALDAEMAILGDAGERTLAADEYFKSQPARLFKDGELLASLTVPAVIAGNGAGAGFGYHKEVRTAAGFSMMTAAARVTLEAGIIKNARVAAGAAVSFPRRLPDLEQALTGGPADGSGIEKAVAGAAAGVSWKGKEGMSDEYAAHLARVILGDVLALALEEAGGGGSHG